MFSTAQKRKRHITPKIGRQKNRFLRYLYPKPNGTFWAFDRPPLSPLYFVKIKSFNGSVEFPEIPRINIFCSGHQRYAKKIPLEPKWGGPLCFDRSWGIVLEGWPSKNRDRLGSRYIYHGPPKLTFLEVFMVNNQVLRWQTPFFSWFYTKDHPASRSGIPWTTTISLLAHFGSNSSCSLGRLWEKQLNDGNIGGKKGTQMGTKYKAENEY